MASGTKILRLFSRLNVGGPSLHVVNLAKGLGEHGYETVLGVGQPENSEGSMEPYAIGQGVAPVHIPGFQAPISPWRDLVAFFSILKLIRRERPDIVHTHTFKAGLLGRLAAWLCGVPVIIHTYHGHLLHGYWSAPVTAILRWVERQLSRCTTHVVAVSRLVADDVIKAGIVPESKISVVPLGFDLERLQEEMKQPSTLRRRFGIPSGDLTVASVGRLVPVKNIELFLQALCPLLARYPRLHLMLVGDGSERAKLEKLADDLCTPAQRARVHFCGFVMPVGPEWKDIDLCLCTSRNEGTSVSIIEAVIAKVPVMSTAVGGMPDLLGDGRFGKLLSEDAVEIRSAVDAWLQTAAAKDAASLEAASAHFRQNFSVQRLVGDTARLYREVSP